jgi:hypothetical protein
VQIGLIEFETVKEFVIGYIKTASENLIETGIIVQKAVPPSSAA